MFAPNLTTHFPWQSNKELRKLLEQRLSLEFTDLCRCFTQGFHTVLLCWQWFLTSLPVLGVLPPRGAVTEPSLHLWLSSSRTRNCSGAAHKNTFLWPGTWGQVMQCESIINAVTEQPGMFPSAVPPRLGAAVFLSATGSVLGVALNSSCFFPVQGAQLPSSLQPTHQELQEKGSSELRSCRGWHQHPHPAAGRLKVHFLPR